VQNVDEKSFEQIWLHGGLLCDQTLHGLILMHATKVEAGDDHMVPNTPTSEALHEFARKFLVILL